jgi:ATP-binding cassette, subfamily B, bacterial
LPTLPFIKQLDAMDCGPTCLAMVCRYYGKSISLQTLRDKTEISKEGVNLLGINNAAESIGFRTQGVQLTYTQIIKEAPLPCILHWGQNHFVVLVKASNRFLLRRNDKITIADPGKGIIKLNKEEFLQHWASRNLDGEAYGVALLLEPTPFS